MITLEIFDDKHKVKDLKIYEI